MYHPSRGGVRGGRDQFKWDDVKVDKHRENYLGHSVKAPVGRWQKGKDLFWYSKDKKSESDIEAAKEEIRRIKEEEEQSMREALGLAPKRATRPQGNRLDKHEYEELIKRGSTAEDMGAGHAEAAQVEGLGLYKSPHDRTEPSRLTDKLKEVASAREEDGPPPRPAMAEGAEVAPEEDTSRKKRHEDRGEGRERKREKKRSRDPDEKRKHRRDKERRRHDSD